MAEHLILLALLLLHLVVCLVLWVLVRLGILDVEGHLWPVALLIPVWGPVCVLLLHLRSLLFGDDLLDETLERLKINEDIHRSILVEGNSDVDTVVPLEEALLVNSAHQKRKLILSILTEDPSGYYDLLQQARLNDDSEVVHYASTALAQISKEADLSLQKLEQKYASAPDDPAVLKEYCDYLENYVASGFVQGRAAEIQQHQLEQLLRKQLGEDRSFQLESKLASLQLNLAEYDRAEAALDRLTTRWPQREGPWLLRLRMAAALHNGADIQKTLRLIDENEVYLSSKGRETVRFWRGGEEQQ